MGTQKCVPKKQKVKLFTLTCSFVKSKFNETAPTGNVQRQFSVLNSSFD